MVSASATHSPPPRRGEEADSSCMASSSSSARPAAWDCAPDEELLRRLRRAAVRKRRVVEVADSDSASCSRKTPRHGRGQPKRRRCHSDEDRLHDAVEEALICEALRPVGMVHQGIRSGALDLVTGGVGPVPVGNAAGGTISNVRVCVRFLSDSCSKGDTCEMQHPQLLSDRVRWIQYFNRQPCKNGSMCPSSTCIYEHPNKASYMGVAAPQMVGTVL